MNKNRNITDTLRESAPLEICSGDVKRATQLSRWKVSETYLLDVYSSFLIQVCAVRVLLSISKGRSRKHSN